MSGEGFRKQVQLTPPPERINENPNCHSSSRNTERTRFLIMESESTQAPSLLSTLGPWIISGIALAQVWVIALFRKIRKPIVEIYESGNIEVGFSNYGPTIGLTGTLRSIHKDSFIKTIKILITRMSDSASHTLNWRALRSNTFSLTQNAPTTLEICSSFLLTTDNPFKYNIVFIDDEFIANISSKVGSIPHNWQKFKQQRLKDLDEEEDTDITTLLEHPMLESILFDEFLETEIAIGAYTILDRAFYWDSDSYGMEIVVQTSNPNMVHSKKLKFEMNEEDIDLLRANTVSVIKAMCGLTDTWNFAYPQYEDL